MHTYSWVLCENAYSWEEQLAPFRVNWDDDTEPPMRWDWYQLGGRYARTLLVKEGHYGIKGEDSWQESKWKEGYDLCRLQVIDWERMRREREPWMRPGIICNGKSYLRAFYAHDGVGRPYTDRYHTEWWSDQLQQLIAGWTADGWLAVVDLHT